MRHTPIIDTLKVAGGLLLVAVMFYLLLLFSGLGCSRHSIKVRGGGHEGGITMEKGGIVPYPYSTPTPASTPTPTPGKPYAFTPIYFDFDAHNLRGDARQTVGSHVVQMIHGAGKGKVFLLEGHCDERGTLGYNLALGQRRADAVKSGLVEYGIAPGRLRTVSYGEERPVDQGHDEAAWQRNRRVEFKKEN